LAFGSPRSGRLALTRSLRRQRRCAICFVCSDDGAGLRTRAAALPVRLGPEGLTEIILPPLTIVERIALENAMLI
jgi:malate/lactate dehydrogenase